MSPSERISKIIEYSGLSSSEFADRIEVQRSSISHITSGRNKPSLDFLIKVKQSFPEFSWDWLILGDEPMLTSPFKEKALNQADTPSSREERSSFADDLFSLIGDEDLGITESEDRILPQDLPLPTISESSTSSVSADKTILSDSQRLENDSVPKVPVSEKTSSNEPEIKRIVLFYTNGKFEAFEP